MELATNYRNLTLEQITGLGFTHTAIKNGRFVALCVIARDGDHLHDLIVFERFVDHWRGIKKYTRIFAHNDRDKVIKLVLSDNELFKHD